MALSIPPGILFLARGLQKAAIVIAVVSGLHYVANRFGGFSVSPWTTFCVVLLLAPLLFIVSIIFGRIGQKRAAKTLGARLAPVTKGNWIGNADILQEMVKRNDTDYPAQMHKEFAAVLGNTINFRILWDDVIFTTNPDCIKAILATDFPNFVKGSKFFYAMESVLGNGVFNSDGDIWKFHRTMTRPFFTRDRISDFDTFDRHADQLMQRLTSRIREGHAVDFQDAASRFTLDAATDFLFGACVDSLSADLPYPPGTPSPDPSAAEHPAEQFARAFQESQHIIGRRSTMGGTWPLTEVFEDKTAAPMKVVNAFIEPIIEKAVSKQKESPLVSSGDDKVEEGTTLLDHLVQTTSDPVVLKDEILNMLIAGRDTTASTLTFLMYALAMYPHVFTRLRQEVLEHVGRSRRPSYDDIREMKYLRAVINETLRLFPPVPFDVRASVNATTLPSDDPLNPEPIYIPANTTVGYAVILMHRRKDLWGPDAEEFDPDRWLDARLKKYVTPHPFIFLPFNAGPRICLGQQFAYNETSFLVIRLLQRFSGVELTPDMELPWPGASGRKGIERVRLKQHLTMYARDGLWVKLTEDTT